MKIKAAAVRLREVGDRDGRSDDEIIGHDEHGAPSGTTSSVPMWRSLLAKGSDPNPDGAARADPSHRGMETALAEAVEQAAASPAAR